MLFRSGDEQFTDLGKMEDAVFFDGGKPTDKSWEVCRIDTPEDQAKTLALAGKRDVIVVETSDWTIIPLENMIAKFRSSGTKVYAIATRKEDAELYLKTMEKGVDGVVIQTDDPLSISKFRDLLTVSEPVSLDEVEVVSVKPLEMGDREIGRAHV